MNGMKVRGRSALPALKSIQHADNISARGLRIIAAPWELQILLVQKLKISNKIEFFCEKNCFVCMIKRYPTTTK